MRQIILTEADFSLEPKIVFEGKEKAALRMLERRRLHFWQIKNLKAWAVAKGLFAVHCELVQLNSTMASASFVYTSALGPIMVQIWVTESTGAKTKF